MRKIAYLILLLLSLSLSSCSDDSKTELSVVDAQQAYNDLRGTYVGNVMDENVPTSVAITIGQEFTVRNLPVTPMLKHFFKDADLSAAVASVRPGNFVAPTLSMSIVADQLYLLMEPTDWTIPVTVGGKTYQMNALMSAAVLYSNTYKTVSMNLEVTELSCDGKVADLSSNRITYFVDSAIKQ